MKRLIFFLGTALCTIFFPHNMAPEPLPLHSVAQDEHPSQTSYHPQISVHTPPTTESKKCTVPADTSILGVAEETFDHVTQLFPCELLQTLRNIEIMDDPKSPRALAGRYTLKVRRDAIYKPELHGLLTHELCHVMGLGGLRGNPKSGKSPFKDGSLPIYNDNPALQFYTISWTDSHTQKQDAHPSDFISGYAQSDMFEDFAEACHLYINHGSVFKSISTNNQALTQKYQFFRDVVFDGAEFDTGDHTTNMNPRPWDATKIGI